MRDSDYYDRPIRIGEGVYWIGFHEKKTNLHCNPYLIVEGDKAVVMDAGSRPDFPVVMMKILQTGIDPKQIVALIYQHIDPDLCGSMSNFVDICENEDLRIVSDAVNDIFIRYYIEASRHNLIETIDNAGFELTFNGRTLQFFRTPYAHTAGSFITYDVKTKTLFTSDLFGSLSEKWDLFLTMADECALCTDYDDCILGKGYCPLKDILEFHRVIMPCKKSLRHAMNVIKDIDFTMIAPQHGSIIVGERDANLLINKLIRLEGVGIDAIA